MNIAHEHKIYETDIRYYSLRIIDLNDNPEYNEAVKKLASFAGFDLNETDQYEFMVIYVVDDVELGSAYNERFNTYEGAKDISSFVCETLNENMEKIKTTESWSFDEPILNFLITHRN